jgi:sugar phosphate isomerase/epimerase
MDAVLSFHSLPPVPIEERVVAARAGGFDRIGLSCRRIGDWLAAGHDLGELRDLLAAHGVAVAELEALHVLRAEPDPHENVAFALAEALGAGYVQVIGPYEGSCADAVARFGAFCDRAGEHGLAVGLEFLPWTNVPDAAAAALIVTRAGRPNGGVCVDLWHLHRSGWTLAGLGPLWPAVCALQLNDGPRVAEDPDLLADCLRNRRLPGDGEFDVATAVAEARRRVADLRLSVEVIAERNRHRPVVEVATELGRAVRRVQREEMERSDECRRSTG